MAMLACDNCDAIFDERDSGTVYEHIGERGEWGMNIPYACCPECGCMDLSRAKECAFCGEYAHEDNTADVLGECMCYECVKTAVRGFVKDRRLKKWIIKLCEGEKDG